MSRFIVALPASLALVALLPMLSFFAACLSVWFLGTGFPAIMETDRFTALVFDGITIAAPLFLVGFFALLVEVQS
jgi:hypothetical protein